METILVLEDSNTNREIIAKVLSNLGYNVLTAENGEEGLKCVERCENENLNLVAVVSDVLMPLVDGPSFAFRLREETRYEDLPIIFMTSATDKNLLLTAKKLKAVGYILKPVDFKQLEAQLRELFPERQFPLK